ncbi:MAG TPA: type II secretion system F family protein [Polyangiaceae bacterium LLY-WYZ-15_(1-7)]|nr:type II secretion system F family protein [Polyangiaceae bacterium LLY-WYZ-15_(1-7)]
MTARIIGYAALACIGGGLFVVTFILGRNPPVERPELGSPGLKRRRALEEGGIFKAFEPAMRLVAGWMQGLPIHQTRKNMQQQITYAGDYLGLSANELLALCILSSVSFAAVGLGMSYMADIPVIMVIFGVGLGAYLPIMQVSGEAQLRFKEVNRSLPTAIDLASLCMGAGLDFPGALRQIVEKSSSKDKVLVEELGRILQELELGHTRRKALEGFAERVPIEAVKDFVGTVVQAEAKGTPLAEVLSIQARMLRMRRSVRAEESAAKAGLMMMGPLMMMFMCIILLLLGPFVVQWMGTGLSG